MKVKIFKCITNGDTSVDCSLHTSFKDAVFAATRFVGTYDETEAARLFEEAEISMEEGLGKNDEEWSDENWSLFFALFLAWVESCGIMGVNTVKIEAETVEINTASLNAYALITLDESLVGPDAEVFRSLEELHKALEMALKEYGIELPYFDSYSVARDSDIFEQMQDFVNSLEGEDLNEAYIAIKEITIK